jgi:hypothetical protein
MLILDFNSPRPNTLTKSDLEDIPHLTKTSLLNSVIEYLNTNLEKKIDNNIGQTQNYDKVYLKVHPKVLHEETIEQKFENNSDEILSILLKDINNMYTNEKDYILNEESKNQVFLLGKYLQELNTLYKEKNVDKNANYPMAQYCLVVRFYGYNENGELVTTGRSGTNGQTNLTDPKAIVEKFYPFVITNLKFRIPKDRVVEYQVEAKPIPHFYNKSQDRGSIPFNFELVGETVQQVLQGKPVGTVYPASQGERRVSPQPNTSAPSQPAEPTIGAGVDANGNFTGDVTSGSFSSVVGA